RSDNGVRIAYAASAGRLTRDFLIGRDPRTLLGEIAALLGPAPMPPPWAVGLLQSTRDFPRTPRLRPLPPPDPDQANPCRRLVYPSTYGEARGWNRGVGHLEFQPDLFADAAAVLQEAQDQHFELTTHEYPVLHEDSPLFAEAESRGYLLTAGYERVSAN